jgi:hypothetical protein
VCKLVYYCWCIAAGERGRESTCVVLSRHVPCRRTLTSRYDLSSPCTAMAIIPITNYRHVLHIIDMDFYFNTVCTIGE